MKWDEITLEDWYKLQPGQKAKMALDLYCQVIYPQERKEKYQLRPGRDMNCLKQIFAIEELATPEEVARRLLAFVRKNGNYYAGHPLNRFNWNEFAPHEISTTSHQRQGATQEDIERVTRSITDKISPAQTHQRSVN